MSLRPAWVALASAAILGSCSYVALDFSKPLSPREIALEQEIRSLYAQVQAAFAAGNADLLTDLFSPSITHPMTHEEIRAWSRDFFARNGRARFHIQSFSFDKLSYVQPVVTLKYRVETPSGKDDFGAVETDTLAQINGRWYIAAWDKQPQAPASLPSDQLGKQ